MYICGLNKTTLLDFPGKVACTIFLGGCNFRCPFCHNSSLVLSPQQEPLLSEEEIFSFLKKRQGILEGVCITGGEPTQEKSLISFIEKIHDMGYPVKLDTNGSRPWILKKLVRNQLIDQVAMDIKSSPSNYAKVSGIKCLDLAPIRESVDFLLSNAILYEFRTTVVRELHSTEDFEEIGRWIAGCQAYYLQAYKDSAQVMIPGFTSCSRLELESFQTILKETIQTVEIRGLD